MKTTFAFNPAATGFDRVTAYWLGCAAKLAYGTEEEIRRQAAAWGMDRCEYISSAAQPPEQIADTQVFVMANRHIVVTAFRGTEGKSVWDWLTDLGIKPEAGPNGVGTVHQGFSRAVAAVYDPLVSILSRFSDAGQSLWFTGHSLGAALAVIMARRLQLEANRVPAGIYTFGQPRTGDAEFSSAFDSQLKAVSFRVVNNNDIVPHLPTLAMGYRDIGNLRYIDSKGALVDDPSDEAMRRDGLEGQIAAARDRGPDGINDHLIGHYLQHLEKLLHHEGT